MAAASEPSEDGTENAESTQRSAVATNLERAKKTYSDFEIPYDQCLFCGLQHNCPEFGPLCTMCHDFLYPVGIRCLDRYTDLEDGVHVRRKHEPEENGHDKQYNGCETPEANEKLLGLEEEMEVLTLDEIRLTEDEALILSKLPFSSIRERTRGPYLVAQRIANGLKIIDDDLIENLPPEILQIIFSYLDEPTVCMVSQVCKRWRTLAGTRHPYDWKHYVHSRWPLLRVYNPLCGWRNLYLKLLQNVTCRRCFERGCREIPHTSQLARRELVEMQGYPRGHPNRRGGMAVCIALYNFEKSAKEDAVDELCSWRNKRIRTELRNLINDTPPGIRAIPLDSTYTYWHASIEGPPNSPYENGVFFLLVETLGWYPIKPPAVRFLTRIFHPNISFHGDVGLDTLLGSWSLALTMPKVLICVQSLLTDPNCHISMEPEVSQLYLKDRNEFNRIARSWTDKYAKVRYRS